MKQPMKWREVRVNLAITAIRAAQVALFAFAFILFGGTLCAVLLKPVWMWLTYLWNLY